MRNDLYSTTTLKCSKLITQHYSTSFTLGIKTLNKKFQLPIYAIYGFVRYADEIVDTFHEYDKKALLDKFENDTKCAIKDKISLNPVLHSFQMVVNDYQIDEKLISAFLHSMRMDLTNQDYSDNEYKEYIYGSAEVVGLMCLKVFCEGKESYYQQLMPSAKSLGAAFQKVNFLRDIKSDFDERGRVYFPDVDFFNFKEEEKLKIEEDISNDFKSALEGIKKLPSGARGGVYLAYIYYLQLFKKLKNLPPSSVLKQRIRVPDSMKLLLLGKTLFLNRVNMIS